MSQIESKSDNESSKDSRASVGQIELQAEP